MRGPFVSLLVWILLVSLGSIARAAGEAPVEMVVFHAPADAPASVIAARDALSLRARRAGIAWVDVSPAAAPAPEAPAKHRQAIEAYEALRFDEALAALDGAIAEVERTGAAGLTPAQLSDLFLYRGLTYTQRGDATRAWDDLVRAAVLDPTRVLDPLRFPTRAVEAFGRARERVLAEARGKVSVDAPAGCEVAIDGARASGPVEVPFGEHFVRVACAGERPWGARVSVAAASVAVTPVRAAEAAPGDAELRTLGRTRGATVLVFVQAQVSPGAPPTLSLRRIDVVRGVSEARASVALAPGGAATPDAEAAFERVLVPAGAAGAAGSGGRPGAVARAPWWKSPWLWAGVGAAVATAIVLPFALGADEGSSDVTIAPSGWTW